MERAVIAGANQGARRLLALVSADWSEVADAFSPVSAAAVIAARHDLPLEAILMGRAAQPEHVERALGAGANAVWSFVHPTLTQQPHPNQLVAAFVAALSHPALAFNSSPTLSLLAANAVGEEVAARLAVQLEGAALGRCTGLELNAHEITARRAAYSGRATLTMTGVHPRCFASMRAPQVRDDVKSTAVSEARVFSFHIAAALPDPVRVREQPTTERRPRLEGAEVIVAGGRGVGAADGFSLLDDLADCLGGSVGGSLPTVDAGWLPVARQVGQSGKYVSPQLYIAVGISGTPQHMAGVDRAARIVALNNDPDADIFRYAEIGVTADWQDFLPALIARLRERP